LTLRAAKPLCETTEAETLAETAKVQVGLRCSSQGMADDPEYSWSASAAGNAPRWSRTRLATRDQRQALKPTANDPAKAAPALVSFTRSAPKPRSSTARRSSTPKGQAAKKTCVSMIAAMAASIRPAHLAIRIPAHVVIFWRCEGE